jgi:hypothetical protein
MSSARISSNQTLQCALIWALGDKMSVGRSLSAAAQYVVEAVLHRTRELLHIRPRLIPTVHYRRASRAGLS